MNTITSNAERLAFEAIVRDCFDPTDQSLNRTPDGVYYNTVGTKSYGGKVNPQYAMTQMLWTVFQAARSSPGAGLRLVPEGWKLVPIEASPEMLEAAWQRNKLNEGTADAYEGVVKNHFAVEYKFMLAAAPSIPDAEGQVRQGLSDDFNGDDAALCRGIDALLALDAAGALVPHGVGGHARSLLSAAYARLGGSR